MEAGTGALPLRRGDTDPARGVRACAGTSLHPGLLQHGQQEPGRAFPVPLGFPTPTKVTPGSVEARAQHPAGRQLIFEGIMFPKQL